MIMGTSCKILLPVFLFFIPVSVQAAAGLEWFDPTGPWASGPGSSYNYSGGGLVEQTAIGNTFMLVGTSSPVDLLWRITASGSAVALDPEAWDSARLEFNGLGWLDETTSDPWDVSNATQIWGHYESLGPPPALGVWFGGTMQPVVARFTVYPDVIYTLKQWNLSKLNMFDLGYFNATMSSEVTLVPEPGSVWPLLLGGAACRGLTRRVRRRRGRP